MTITFANVYMLWALCGGFLFLLFSPHSSLRKLPVGSFELWVSPSLAPEQHKPNIFKYNLWSLLLQIIIYSLIIIACARPKIVIPFPAKRDIHIAVDCSASMQTRVAGKTVFAHSINRLRQMLSQLQQFDHITLYAYPGGKKYEGAVKNIMGDIQKLSPSQQAVNFSEVLPPLIKVISSKLYFLTDGTEESISSVIPIVYGVKTTNNVGIVQFEVTAAPQSPSQYRVFAIIHNFSPHPAQIPIALQGNQLVHRQMLIPARQKTIFWQVVDATSRIEMQLRYSDNFALDNKVCASKMSPLSLWIPTNAPQAFQKIPKAIRGLQQTDNINAAIVHFSPLSLGWLLHHASFSPKNIATTSERLLTDIAIAADPLWQAVYPDLLEIHSASYLLQPGNDQVRVLLESTDGIIMAYSDNWLYIGFSLTQSNWSNLPSFPIFFYNFFNYLAPSRNKFFYIKTQPHYPSIGFHEQSQQTIAVNLLSKSESANASINSLKFSWPPQPSKSNNRIYAMMPLCIVATIVCFGILWYCEDN